MKKVAGFVALVIAVLLYTGTAASAWTPPIGIPAPPFGINETAGPFTHYVDNSVACNDSNSAGRGSATAPRCTIPTTLAAGSVVEVHGGPYIYQLSSQTAITCNGTVDQPVFIRGIGLPSIQGPGTVAQGYGQMTFRLGGSYYIMEGFLLGNGTPQNNALEGHHGVLRNSEVANVKPPAGSNAGLFGKGTYMVVYNNKIHDNGNYLNTIDDKVHGIVLGTPNDHWWILDNHIYQNGGQSIQLGQDFSGPDPTLWPHHIYVGRNNMHGDRDAAIDVKQTSDIIISQNHMHDYVPPPCTTTHAYINMGVKFSAHNVWVIFNESDHGGTGMRANQNNNYLYGTTTPLPSDIYFIGNFIHDIAYSPGPGSVAYSPTNAYSDGAAISGWENTNIYVIDNTIVNSQKGISGVSTGNYQYHGNLIVATGDPMTYITSSPGGGAQDYDFFDPLARVAWGETTPIYALSQIRAAGQEVHGLEGAALLDATYKPMTGSKAIGANVRSQVYDTFLSLYGIDIAKDIGGAPRPQGSAWTIGAFEFTSGGTAPPPAPTGLIVR